MFQLKSVFFGERSVTKVAGLFSTNEAARQAAQNLVDHSPLDPSQIRVLGPSDTAAVLGSGLGRAMEPDSKGIARTLVKSHLAAGLLGMLAGMVLFGVMMLIGIQAIVSSPFLSFVTFTGFGLIFGLMAGGAVSMRPDHGHVLTGVRRALEEGQWAVIAHPRNAEQTDKAVKAMEPGSDRVLRSL